jgi:lysylphosphatidylglycerol synthetase-like protein (DUF2156 family)
MLTSAVMAQDLPEETKTSTLVAINKVMWIQNDLFARHYISNPTLKTIQPMGVEHAMPTAVLGLVMVLAFVIYRTI